MENQQEIKSDIINLSVIPIKEIYYSYKTSYGVYKCYEDSKKHYNDTLTIIGIMPRLIENQKYDITLKKVNNPKYGEQFEFQQFTSMSKPESPEDERSFFKNFVTEIQYKEITKVYDKPITAILSGNFDISKIKYLGERNLKAITKRIKENLNLITISNEISKYDIDFKTIKKITDHYKNAELALQKIKEDPYCLYKDIDGIGFKRADIIAHKMGIKDNDPKRILAGISYCLEQEEKNGNTYGYLEDIHDKAETLLEVQIDSMNDYIQSKDFYVDDMVLARSKTYSCEMDIAQELYKISQNNIQFFNPDEINDNIQEIENKIGIKYDEKQKQLITKINQNNVVCLTGFAGTGKSSTLRLLLDILDKQNLKYMLMSPTARAAKKMEETTGKKASTIHRALGYFEGTFAHNKNNPFATDIIIIDEISMIDIFLFKDVLEAIPEKCKLLCVGDYAQLESINVGAVLYDMIQSEVIPCIKLDKVFRQQNGSKLLDVITDIREGKIFFDSKQKFMEIGTDCKLWFGNKDVTAQHIVTIYKECLKKYSPEDIMVISPMKKGNSGIINLNSILQNIANPADEFKTQVELKKCTFRTGDIVMHIKNDYNAEVLDENYESTMKYGVFNGDMGYIKEIKLNKTLEIYVDYQGNIIKYTSDNLNELELAYAITVHKSQGGQAKVVILAMDTSHYIMLKRSLVYTGVSRASKLLIIAADPRALKIAIQNNEIIHKRTFLCEDLKKVFIKNFTSS